MVAGDKLNKFFYSNAYLFAIAIVTAVLFMINKPYLSLAIFSLTACIVLLFYGDFTPFMPILLLVMLPLNDINIFTTVWPYIILSPAILCLIFHFFLYPVKKFRLGKLFIPFCVITVALLLGGLGSIWAKNYLKNLIMSLSAGPLLLLIYLLFLNFINPPKNFDLKGYFATFLSLVGACIVIEYLWRNYLVELKLTPPNALGLGWGNVNTAAAMLLFCIPACWYLFTKRQNLLFNVFLLLLLYSSLFIIDSQMTRAITIVFTPGLMIITCLKADTKTKKLLNVLYFLIILGTVCALYYLVIANGGIKQLLVNIFDIITRDSRDDLINDAIKEFLKHPILGVGQGYENPDLIGGTNMVVMFNFHCVFAHLLATTGIVGTLAYGYYYYSRCKILMDKYTTFNLFMAIGFTMIQIYSFVDAIEFTIMPLMMYLTIYLVVTELSNGKKESILPLKTKSISFIND